MSRRRGSATWSKFVALALFLAGCGGSYPPPLLASSAPPTIRVRLGAPRSSGDLKIAGRLWEITSSAGRSYGLREEKDLAVALSAGASGIAVGGRDTGATALRVRSGGLFTLDGTSYPGVLLVRREAALLVFVNETDLETYVAGVIPNECAPCAEPATHRAQAVTARTYAYARLLDSDAGEAPWHLKDNESAQVYKGFTIAVPNFGATAEDMVRRAAETRGVILTWQSRPFPAYYSSTCGGHTTDAATSRLDAGGAADPLRGVPCPFCTTSKYYRWTRQVTDADLVAGFKKQGYPVLEPLQKVEVTSRGTGDWAREVTVTYGAEGKTRALPGVDFRSALGLPSHKILAVTKVPGGFSVDGAGWGHGVGMCQWGSLEMGRRGFSDTDILRYYYPGISFTRVY